MRTALLISAFIVLSIGIAFTIRTDVAGVSRLPSMANPAKVEEKVTGSGVLSLDVLHKWEVPQVLKEISALTYIGPQRFACVQDELGKIFIYNTQKDAIEKEIPFAPPGDYEGLAIAGKDAYVLRADGRIFEVRDYDGTKPKIFEHPTSLTKKHDTEGLCYDSKGDRLLIAIKEKEPASDDYKGIYSFSLINKSFAPEPVYKIDLNNKVFEDVKTKKPGAEMQPSAIAVHPQTGDIYIAEATKPKLLIIDRKGSIKSLENLKDKDFNQPEGISFDPQGNLFVANEGDKKEPGNILQLVGLNK